MGSRGFNVCFLNDRLFPVGGTAIRTLNFARAIRNRVNEVSMITWQPTDTKEYRDTAKASSILREGISIDMMPLGHHFLRKHLRLLYILTVLVEFSNFTRKAVQERKTIDVIHCANDTIWVGVLLKRIMKKPIVADIHGYFFGKETSPDIAKKLRKLLYKSAFRIADKSIDIYIVPTQELKDLLVSLGLSPKKLKVIPNALYLRENGTGRSRSAIRRELGLDEDTIAIAFHGILTERYNIDALNNLNRISRIIAKETDKKVKFIVMGFYEKVPVHDENFIYTGYVENLHEYLRAADFAVIPIFENSLGIRSRLLDYFAVSLPVLTTTVGLTGMGFVQDSAAVVVRNNIEELARSVIELANSPEKLRKMAHQSKTLAAWFSPEKIAKELLSLYLQATKQVKPELLVRNTNDHV